jgi:hypothetical protein
MKGVYHSAVEEWFSHRSPATTVCWQPAAAATLASPLDEQLRWP